MDGYSNVPTWTELEVDEKRVVELALRQLVGTYDECVADEALEPEERTAFENDRRVALRMLDEVR